MKNAILALRVLFGAFLVANALNHFFLSLWPEPVGHTPLAMQLMAALAHSHLLDVALAIQLVTGVLILTGFFVPVALCVAMPVSTCALYWALILDHQPAGALLAFLAFAANGLLMLAYIDYYDGALARRAPALGEA